MWAGKSIQKHSVRKCRLVLRPIDLSLLSTWFIVLIRRPSGTALCEYDLGTLSVTTERIVKVETVSRIVKVFLKPFTSFPK